MVTAYDSVENKGYITESSLHVIYFDGIVLAHANIQPVCFFTVAKCTRLFHTVGVFENAPTYTVRDYLVYVVGTFTTYKSNSHLVNCDVSGPRKISYLVFGFQRAIATDLDHAMHDGVCQKNAIIKWVYSYMSW